ncbi:hypothetical protein [Spiroplasma ixodetis]|uniref:hypothetical protein n=1 Tax=Spiroplasma ixodetis TaxID=2141 RepID=UPI0025760CED|nr:hypothetical protein [Spiroplasma ixodetis]
MWGEVRLIIVFSYYRYFYIRIFIKLLKEGALKDMTKNEKLMIAIEEGNLKKLWN